MKRVALAFVSTITGLVMLLTFKTHALDRTADLPAAVSSTGTAAGGVAATGSGRSSATTPTTRTSPAKGPSAKKSGAGSKTTTETGNVVETPYGPIEVRITVTAGKVAGATVVQYPDQNPRSEQINSYAIPILNAEATRASSADIAHVSGATYTSGGYISSLQSVLNRAGL